MPNTKKKNPSAVIKRSSGQPVRIQVIIETPRGSRNKLKFDPVTRHFKLSKVLPEGMMFPYDFGYVPSTKAEDGDPLDVLVLSDDALFPGCLVDCVLIGVIEAEQEEQGEVTRNDRLIAVAEQSLLYAETRTLRDLNPTLLKQIEDFFANYQRARNIRFTVLARGEAQQTRTVLQKASHKQKAA
ncbi:MAG TPA: inorganic diphosphatase [Candidatus Sulfotelmatobacter sp.]|nr:inorganic diphosphatase [Candidatus Sulfotelmatobacter sp.]